MFIERSFKDGGGAHVPVRLPLLEMQRAYYVGLNAENGGEAYLYFEIDLPEFERVRFDAAWKNLWERHEALRLVVDEDGGQSILNAVPPDIEVFDLREMSASDRDDTLLIIRNDTEKKSFALDKLLQIKISLLESNAARLHMRVSLLIADGQGLATLLGDLADLCISNKPLVIDTPSFTEAINILGRKKVNRERSIEWWHKRIPDLPESPDLPIKPSSESAPLKRRRMTLNFAKWNQFQDVARMSGLTPSMAICAAFANIIGAFSSTNDFLMALMISERPRNGMLDNVVGNFSSLSLLPVRQSAGATFIEFARTIQDTFFACMEHSAFSGLEVLSEINRAKKQVFNASAPVVFSSNLHLPRKTQADELYGPFSIYGPQWAYSSLQSPQVLLDVSVSLSPENDLIVHWDSREELFYEGVVDAMTEAFEVTLERLSGMVGGWHELVYDIPREQVEKRNEANQTKSEVYQGLLHELFYEHWSDKQARLAVIDGDLSLSYEEILEVTKDIAAVVADCGLEADQLVAVVMEKGWEQIAAVLGVLSAGVAYLPIDPRLPQERINYLLKSSQITLAITTDEFDDLLEWPEGIKRYTPSLSKESSEVARQISVKPNDLAYVIFTSGSTGDPKGVMIEHRSAVNTVVDINKRFGIAENDRVFGISALNFDLSVWDIFGALFAGATLILPSSERLSDPAHWYELIHSEGVTVWNSAPSVMQLLVEYAESINGYLPQTIRLVMLSGDWIPTTLPDRIRALSKEKIDVISLGGATEASIWSIVYPILNVSPDWASIPYGKPLANQTFQILDRDFQPKPDWVPGEIYIGGDGLARGYWRDARKTSNSFITHPVTEERLYKTGDYGRYLPDGNIEFLGRRDNQIKLRGYRIELGEIEALLLKHQDIIAAVAGVREQGEERILVAYCVTLESLDKEVISIELMRLLESKLPSYMCPQMIFMLDALPLTSNGKVDRKRLAELDLEVSHKGSGRDVDGLEMQIANIFAEVLGYDDVGIEDNFFELGGNSFAAVRVMTKLRQEFGSEFPLSLLLQNQEPRQLAGVIKDYYAVTRKLIELRRGEGRVPVIFIHAAGGNALSYQPLSKLLSDGFPFYAIEAYGLAKGERPLERIEDFASMYTKLVLENGEHKSVVLGGWSSGGIVAYEMAHQLQALGVEVKHLLLIDSPVPIETAAVSDDMAIDWFIKDIFNGEPDGSQWESNDDSSSLRLGKAIRAKLAAEGLDDKDEDNRNQLERVYKVFRATLDALRKYQPRRLSVPATIFKADGPVIQEFYSHPAVQKDDWGWGDFLENLDTQSLEGDHYQILEGGAMKIVSDKISSIF